MAGLFVFVYYSTEKGNLFFGSFYFTAEIVKSIFGRPLLWDSITVYMLYSKQEPQIPERNYTMLHVTYTEIMLCITLQT